MREAGRRPLVEKGLQGEVEQLEAKTKHLEELIAKAKKKIKLMITHGKIAATNMKDDCEQKRKFSIYKRGGSPADQA
jgi:hypothetical protein